MLLEFQKRSIEPDIVVLELVGKIIRGPESQAVEKLVDDALRRGQKKLILDLSRIQSIDSTGLGVIVHSVTEAKKAGGTLRLASPSDPVRRELKISKVDTIFPVYPTVEAACESFPTAPQSGP